MKGFAGISAISKPKTNLFPLKTPKKVLCGLVKFTVTLSAFFKIAFPIFRSSSNLAIFGAVFFTLRTLTAKLSPRSIKPSKDVARALSVMQGKVASQLNSSRPHTLVIADLDLTASTLSLSALTIRT